MPKNLLLMLCIISSSMLSYPSYGANPSPEQKIQEIKDHIQKVNESADTAKCLEYLVVASTQIEAELSLFELKYGVHPKDVANWNEVQVVAKDSLKRYEKLKKRILYIDADSAKTAYCLLLELAGYPEKALKELGKVKAGGFCGNWMATVEMAVNRHRAGIYQRQGDYEKALKYLELAISSSSLSLYHPAEDVLIAQHALLLEKAGKSDEIIAMHQKVVDLFPGTAGSAVSESILKARNSYAAPTAVRLLDRYASKKKADAELGDALIFAIAGHKFPESYGILMTRLEKGQSYERNRVIPALGMLGDRRTIPALINIVESSDDSANCCHAIKSLHILGDDTHLVPYLMKCVTNNEYADVNWMNDMLIAMFPEGPKFEEDYLGSADGVRVYSAWLEWLQEHHIGEPVSHSNTKD